ncbi:glycosyltransferase family 2 protein [Phaeocystidibacter marisrubri]|uniref:Glycosyltransferase family 2 protein n=1 Tax=Phaeocystidibacter marisrubri TaxID=1577780 RepID=A0A6L3ZDB2_9FLAO|nr:glycosyltransferase family A protein [Phaeocystidibacter marisrubri]KAB2815660.1 glycosyltransferase family 2 protein [Phaeocystidibacter marisrubri]GGH65038.1 hypothetical protein GCM10011318_01660 [Phaeocystidibacter marisrubri]
MTIGVLIPVFNAESTLTETLNSVVHQTRLPDAICIVNDGSTDRSASIIQDFLTAHPDLPVEIITRENGGLGSARNAGMEKLTTDYIAFLDADDVWTPHKLEHISKAILNHPEADLIYHPIWEWCAETGQIRKRRDQPILSPLDIWTHNPITPSACAIRKKAMDWSFETDPSIHGVEDALLWTVALFHQCTFVRIPNVDTRYRLGHGMTKNEEEHECHVENAVELAANRGWISAVDLSKFRAQRHYHMARNAHKRREFSNAVQHYAASENTFKSSILKLLAWAHIRV